MSGHTICLKDTHFWRDPGKASKRCMPLDLASELAGSYAKEIVTKGGKTLGALQLPREEAHAKLLEGGRAPGHIGRHSHYRPPDV